MLENTFNTNKKVVAQFNSKMLGSIVKPRIIEFNQEKY